MLNKTEMLQLQQGLIMKEEKTLLLWNQNMTVQSNLNLEKLTGKQRSLISISPEIEPIVQKAQTPQHSIALKKIWFFSNKNLKTFLEISKNKKTLKMNITTLLRQQHPRKHGCLY